MTGGCPVSELCKYYTEPWWNKSTTASSTSVTYNIPSTIVATFNVIKKEKEN